MKAETALNRECERQKIAIEYAFDTEKTPANGVNFVEQVVTILSGHLALPDQLIDCFDTSSDLLHHHKGLAIRDFFHS
jgi:hypothetical protein